MPALLNDIFRESLQRILVAHVAHKPVTGFYIDDMNDSVLAAEPVGEGFSDPVRPASDDGDLALKASHAVSLAALFCWRSVHSSWPAAE